MALGTERQESCAVTTAAAAGRVGGRGGGGDREGVQCALVRAKGRVAWAGGLAESGGGGRSGKEMGETCQKRLEASLACACACI